MMKPQLLVNVRSLDTSEAISLDIARHLPRRLVAGDALILVDRPQVWLAVLRKRWMHIIREVERERASTLDRWKRTVLEVEINRMRELRFGAAPVSHNKPAAVLIASTDSTPPNHQRFCSLYITTPVSGEELARQLAVLNPGGLLTLYCEWQTEYDQVVRNYRHT